MTIDIVTIEDFPLMRDALAVALSSREDMNVLAACPDGASGIAAVRQTRPHIALLDLSLPDAGGMSVLDRLIQESPHVRVIVLTACERPDRVMAVMAAGARGYVSKRTPIEGIVQAIIDVHHGETVVSPNLAGQVLSLQRGDQASAVTGSALLAPQEVGVLRRVASGHTDQQIANEMYISVRTVQNYLARIRRKTGMRRRAELTRWAIEHSWL